MFPRGRSVGRPESAGIDRWPAVDESLRDLLAECEAIVDQGRAAFDAPRSLTYRAAEAVIIHFSDLIERRIPDDRAGTVPSGLPIAAVRTTRNILSHNYRAADKTIVWNVVSTEIPVALRAILAANERPPGA